MLTTNLLPLEEKKIFQQEKNRRMIAFLGLLLTAALLLDTAAILPSFLVTQAEERSLRDSLRQEEASATRTDLADILRSAQKNSAMLERVRTFAVVPEKITPILEKIFSGNPGITITGLAVRNDGGVAIAGVARRRADLLQFESALRDFNRFEAFEIPLSSIIQDRDIHFNIQATLKPDNRL